MYSIEVCLLGWCVCVLGVFICWVCICWRCIQLLEMYSFVWCILLLKMCSSTDSLLRQIDYLIQGILNDTPNTYHNTNTTQEVTPTNKLHTKILINENVIITASIPRILGYPSHLSLTLTSLAGLPMRLLLFLLVLLLSLSLHTRS